MFHKAVSRSYRTFYHYVMIFDILGIKHSAFKGKCRYQRVCECRANFCPPRYYSKLKKVFNQALILLSLSKVMESEI